MEILKALITCCGAALVTGIFSVILANKSTKKERQAQNDAVINRLDTLDKKLDVHIQEDAESKTDEARSQILHFGDEVRRGIQHTEEHWADILRDVDRYEDYCDSHRSYENNRATHTIHYLKGVYDEHLRNNDFLK